MSAQRDGQGERLNGEGFHDALGLEGIGYLGNDPEFTKRSQGFQPPSCGVRTSRIVACVSRVPGIVPGKDPAGHGEAD
jgi:hypothetical protein